MPQNGHQLTVKSHCSAHSTKTDITHTPLETLLFIVFLLLYFITRGCWLRAVDLAGFYRILTERTFKQHLLGCC